MLDLRNSSGYSHLSVYPKMLCLCVDVNTLAVFLHPNSRMPSIQLNRAFPIPSGVPLVQFSALFITPIGTARCDTDRYCPL